MPSPELASATGEFGLIARHFQRLDRSLPESVALGIGDDCALLVPSPGHQLAISTDMLVQGRHFFADVAPRALGHKALAVNLSDLAAMGARPLGFTLALALPEADNAWLAEFSMGLFALADAHHCPLVGGDTTRGPLNICITILGEVLPKMALRRDAALAGDDLYVSGHIGEARLALECLRQTPWARTDDVVNHLDSLRRRLERPTPRVELGLALGGLAHAAIDLSDGLTGDLNHILRASGVGAEIDWTALPKPAALGGLPETHQQTCLLQGGDDYELLFTAPGDRRAAVREAALASATPVHRIGRITTAPGLRLIDSAGQTRTIGGTGFDHFG